MAPSGRPLRCATSGPGSTGASPGVLLVSTLALEGSDATTSGGRPSVLLRYADLALLALALPIFLAAGWPMLGYAVAAGAWLVQHAILVWAERASAAALARGDRRRALGIVGGVHLGPGMAGSARGTARRPARRARGRARRGRPLPGADHAASGLARAQQAPLSGGGAREPQGEDLDRGRALPVDHDRPADRARQRGQERLLPAAERVQARPLDRNQHRRDRPLDQQGRALPGPRERVDDRDHELHRQPHAAGAEQGPDGGRDRLRPDPQQHHRRQHPRREAARRSGSPSWAPCSSSSSSRT